MQAQCYICQTCGVQYAASASPPEHCPICEDERQYLKPEGQLWTTLAALNKAYTNTIEKIAPNAYAIYTTPQFGINQRAHLITTPGANILWDCISNLDAQTISTIRELGGIQAIALSHPHYFSTIIEWSKAFNEAPVYINAHDAKWLGRRSNAIVLWEEQHVDLWEGLQLIRCGGHFPGASVLYDPAGKGALFTGDTIQVAANRKTVSFMYSYPNLIPLPKKEILAIQSAVQSLHYDALYGAFGLYITSNAKTALQQSVARYLQIFEEQ